MLTITGYSDRLSVRPGETIRFMVNCEHPTYRADIVRLICADDSPAGPGFKERPVRTPVSRRHKGRRQVIHAGSHALVESRPLLETLECFTVQAMIWPATPARGEQGIITKWDPRSRTDFALVIDEAGSVALRLGMADGTVETVSVGKPLHERHWYLAAASYDAATGTRSRSIGNRSSLTHGRATAASPGARWGRPPQGAARRSSWPAPSSGAPGDVEDARWSARTTTARLICPGLSGAPWTGWRSSGCGTRRPPRRSRQTSSAPGISRATPPRSGSSTAPATTATARSSTCRRAA